MDEQALLERSDGPVTRSRLIHDLTALGLTDGDLVMSTPGCPPSDTWRAAL